MYDRSRDKKKKPEWRNEINLNFDFSTSPHPKIASWDWKRADGKDSEHDVRKQKGKTPKLSVKKKRGSGAVALSFLHIPRSFIHPGF